MAKPRPETEPPLAALTADDLGGIAREIAIEAQKARARILFAERLVAVADLIRDEDKVRQRLKTLEEQAEMVAAVVARADAEQKRLDGITGEIERVKQQAQAEAEGILYDAQQKAQAIIAEAKQAADEEAERRADDLRRVELSIASRQTELERLTTLIAELRAKIGA